MPEARQVRAFSLGEPMSGRFYDPNPVYFNLLSNQPVAGGFLTFYLQGTTTPKGTWSDSALTIPNTNPVPLDSSGRANVNIWLSGAYSVRLTDSLGAVIWTRDVDDGSAGQAQFPPMESGKFLTNDGSVYLWGDVRQVPDPTGSANKVLSTDGSALIWIAQQAIPASNASSGPGFMRIGDYAVQWGRAQCPASGGVATATTVTIPTAYTETPFVLATAAKFPFYSPDFGGAAIIMARASSNNSIEVQMHANIQPSGDTKVIAPVDFTWVAFGKVA